MDSEIKELIKQEIKREEQIESGKKLIQEEIKLTDEDKKKLEITKKIVDLLNKNNIKHKLLKDQLIIEHNNYKLIIDKDIIKNMGKIVYKNSEDIYKVNSDYSIITIKKEIFNFDYNTREDLLECLINIVVHIKN